MECNEDIHRLMFYIDPVYVAEGLVKWNLDKLDGQFFNKEMFKKMNEAVVKGNNFLTFRVCYEIIEKIKAIEVKDHELVLDVAELFCAGISNKLNQAIKEYKTR